MSKKVSSNQVKSAGVEYIEQKYGVEVPDLSSDNTDGLYSIYDTVQKIFLPPFPSPTVEACKRNIVDIVSSQPSSLMAKYPSDYQLYYLAQWNSRNGYISFDVPQCVCSVFQLLASSRKVVDDEV